MCGHWETVELKKKKKKSRVQPQDSGKQSQAVRILAETLPIQRFQVRKGDSRVTGMGMGLVISYWGKQCWLLKSEESH